MTPMPTLSVKKTCPAAASQTLASRRAEREDPDHQGHAQDKQDRQAVLADHFDAPPDAPVQHDQVHGERDEEEQVRRAKARKMLVRNRPLVAPQERGHGLLRVAGIVPAGQGEPTVPQEPGLDVNIVDINDNRTEDADHAEVLDEPALVPQGVEHARGGRVAEAPAEAPHGPLDPHEGQAQQEQGDEVRDHERAAAVLRRLDGEPQEVAQADGASGHGQDDADAAAPAFARHALSLRIWSRAAAMRITHGA
jgi:hypothetical protein